MNFDEIQEEDCTIYIEELKSDDPNLKINAVQKLQQISDILGSERTREELIPYLVDIIEECDNDEEFLLKLSDELLELKDKIGGQEFIVKLVEPLEILSSMEEQNIRQKSTENLLKIVQVQPQQFFQTHFINMVKQLAVWDNFPSRASASYFLPVCYSKITDDQLKKEIFLVYKELSTDDTPMVRRAVADNIGKFTQIVEKQTKKVYLFEIWQNLMKDKIDNVKIKAMENLQYLISDLEGDQINNILNETLKNIDTDKKSWRVRYALAELLPIMSKYVQKDQIKNELIEITKSLLQDQEQEVKSIVLLKLPDFIEKVNKQIIKESLLPIFQNLITDSSQYVRISLASTIIKIGNQLEDYQFVELIIPMIEKIFQDENLEVKIALINSFDNVNLENQNVQDKILGIIDQINNEKNWRVRLALVQYIPQLCSIISFQLYQNKIQNLNSSFINDHYFGIRQSVYNNYIKIMQIFQKDLIVKEIFKNIEQQISSNNYIFRIQALKGIIITFDQLGNNYELTQFFKKVFIQLKNDKIANVRFNLIKTYNHIKKKLNEDLQRDIQNWLKTLLTFDQDIDVKQFASLVMDKK